MKIRRVKRRGRRIEIFERSVVLVEIYLSVYTVIVEEVDKLVSVWRLEEIQLLTVKQITPTDSTIDQEDAVTFSEKSEQVIICR